jgi:replicative DNA helicase
LTELKEKARKVVKNNAVELIIVDYLQLVNAYGIKNREEQISLISRSLKGLAKELNIPIIALAQLSRDVEKRGGKPRLSDLRESGAIEQDADIVGFIHSTLESDGYDNPANDIQEVEVIIAKHRNGETGFFKLNFEKSKSKFHNIN